MNDLKEGEDDSNPLASLSWEELADYREEYKNYLKEKYLKLGDDQGYQHGKYIDSQQLIVKDYIVAEMKECGIPQEDQFIELKHVFDPDDEGFSSSPTVLLQGYAGSGKTAAVHKFLFDWAEGRVTPGRFDFIIYINCRELNPSAHLSAADLITNTFKELDGPILDIVLMYPEKLLFIFDEFPQLQHPVGEEEENVYADPQKKEPVDTLLCNFLRKLVFPESALMITARFSVMKQFQSLLNDLLLAEVLWFTEDEKKSYFLNQFSDADTAMSIFCNLQESEGLDILSSLPIVSWMVCHVLPGEDDKMFTRSLQTVTDVYVFYFSKCLQTLPDILMCKGQSCLWGLCSLAAEGLQKHQVLFDISDLRRHGIEDFDTTGTFLSHFLEKSKDDANIYTFLHFSFQEFLAAVFYALQNDSDGTIFNQMEEMQDLFWYGKGFSSLTIKFLFGLLHKENEKAVEITFGQKIFEGLLEELLQWTEREIKITSFGYQVEPMDLFHCLYELQEDDCVKRLICDLKSIVLYQPTYTKMDILALSFCVKNSTNELSVSLKCQHLLGFKEEKDDSALSPMAPDLTVTESPLHFLCQTMLTSCCKVRELKLIFCHFTYSYGKDLASVLETSQCLAELEFTKCTLEDSAMQFLCGGYKQSNSSLQIVRMYRCLISTASCGMLAAFVSRSEWLTELELSETKLEVTALKLLFEGLKAPTCKLQKFSLSGSLHPETSETVCEYLSSVLICNTYLIELNLSENPLGDTAVKHLCEGLRHPNCSIEILDLNTCLLTDASCLHLSSFLQANKTLRELFLFSNALGDTGVQYLCEPLKHPECKLENLVLSECSLSAASCEALAQVLSSSQNLTRLLLINNKIEDSGVKLLCEGLKQPDCQLQNLGLWTCSLRGECCEDLSNAFYTNEHLIELDLTDNALGDKAMQALCEGLKHPSCKLQTLWLANCQLTDDCCEALAAALLENENLISLDLCGNDIKDFGVQILCDAVIHPTCNLKTLSVDTDHLNEETVQKMEALKISKPGFTW
ncbi:NACHT, LRR and PYD domains-containing protein 12-like isoform X1 [Sorex araneus]|uniref:NACHT, LRR and PYD domains-containing protein 12-like isoform X1 n=1 Tax=Sorex araneus TaxID=42254 RepID=UPI0024334B14|nr:NACHT, LRR and PYD domains-containing protein 12-like isoform X1 [Sorex araneus]XP_054977643.1 NACHT, LRR and PYD domains-containing protein 12-like isoform X1 [Sorex araneus]XP_054977644.1 NACHT, LRR and PYD domains-containing protein 12-like isoform X1 [Sorex araneus]